MKFKALFIDVDGTLLTDELIISPGTKEAVHRLANEGWLISVVTARSPEASLFLYEELKIRDNPIICFNGALILRANVVLYEEHIDSLQVKELLAVLNHFVLNISLYKHHDWFTESMDRWVHQEMEITHSAAREANFNELLSSGFCPNKLLCMGEAPEIEAAEKKLKELGFKDFHINKSKPTYLEIMNKNASKRQGIQKIIDDYGIHRQEIIAIGDNFNDIDMLTFAGTSIAMGNAPDEVKRHATYVTDTNNKEGIQKALDNLLK